MTSTTSSTETVQTAQKTNGMAIAAIIFAFVCNVVGIVLGHISLKKIKQSGERGRGLAIAALVIGYLSVVATVVISIMVVQAMGELQGSYTY